MSGAADRTDTKALLMKPRYDEYAVGLWRHALRLTGDASQAEDAERDRELDAARRGSSSGGP